MKRLSYFLLSALTGLLFIAVIQRAHPVDFKSNWAASITAELWILSPFASSPVPCGTHLLDALGFEKLAWGDPWYFLFIYLHRNYLGNAPELTARFASGLVVTSGMPWKLRKAGPPRLSWSAPAPGSRSIFWC